MVTTFVLIFALIQLIAVGVFSPMQWFKAFVLLLMAFSLAVSIEGIAFYIIRALLKIHPNNEKRTLKQILHRSDQK